MLKCEKDEKVAFADSLRKISENTWRELIMRGKHNGGCEKIQRKNMKFLIPNFFCDDTNCIVFRFSGL